MRVVWVVLGVMGVGLVLAHDVYAFSRMLRLEKENDRLTSLATRQNETNGTLISSLESCRETMDFVTTRSQTSVLEEEEDDVQQEMARRGKKRLRKKKVKPVYWVALGGPSDGDKLPERPPVFVPTLQPSHQPAK